MKSSTVKRSNLSKARVEILEKISENYQQREDIFLKNNYNNDEIVVPGHKIQDNALGVLYKSLSENKNQRKPLIYFFIGLIIGVVSTLFLSAVVLVSDKDNIENDVKAVKENIIESEKTESSDNTVAVTQADSEEVDELGRKIYTVKEGDTLGGIVNRLFGDTAYNSAKVQAFKELNNLRSVHSLRIGQKLIIPE